MRFDKLTAYNQYILEEEFCFRVSKYEKFLYNLKVYQAWNKLWIEVDIFWQTFVTFVFFFPTMTQPSIKVYTYVIIEVNRSYSPNKQGITINFLDLVN